MLLELYRTSTRLGGPLIEALLRRRVRLAKEDPQRLGERQGHPGLPRPPGPLVWLHAASVGEGLAALVLLEGLRARWPRLEVLVTTGTVTSAGLLAGRLPARSRHQFVPVDQPQAWQRFLAHWRPDLALLIESELWPNLILEAAAREVPLVLINARMSDRSFRRWQRIRGTAGAILGRLALVLAQSDDDAARFATLGARSVEAPGNLKLAAPPLPADPQALAQLRAAIGERRSWLAASTHPGEEEQVLAVHRDVARTLPDLLTVIVPRHPDRGEALAALVEAAGLPVARRSLGRLPGPQDAVYLADTMGELGLLYRLAPLALIGGSLVPHGGQNPLEAARLGCPPLFGPHTGNFRDITRRLEDAGAARRVADADALAEAVRQLLTDDGARRALAGRALAAARSEGEVLEATLAALAPFLERAGAGA